jgi:hypothetical protein
MLRSALPLARARIVGFADEELSSFEFKIHQGLKRPKEA